MFACLPSLLQLGRCTQVYAQQTLSMHCYRYFSDENLASVTSPIVSLSHCATKICEKLAKEGFERLMHGFSLLLYITEYSYTPEHDYQCDLSVLIQVVN